MRESASFTIDQGTEAPHRYRWLMLAGVWLLYWAFGLVASSLAPLAGLIESDIGLSHVAMGSIMGAWQLVYIASAVPCGILLDRLGARRAMVIGGVLIACSALARGMADNYLQMLFAVMLFGLGGPIVSAGAPKVIAGWFFGQSRGLAMGIYMTGPAVGGIVSLTMTHSVLLPVLDQSWRGVFIMWAIISLLVSLAWFMIASRPIALTSESDLQASSTVLHGQVLKQLLHQPSVRLVLVMSIGVFLFNHGLNNWLPELLRAGGMDFTGAGYWAAIPTVVAIAGSLLIPRLATPARRFNILIGLSLCAAVASMLLHFHSGVPLLTGLVLLGIARSALMTVLVLALVELPGIGNRYAGIASGLFFSAAEVGGVLGPLSLGLLYDISDGFDTGLYLLTGIAVTLAFSAHQLKRLASE